MSTTLGTVAAAILFAITITICVKLTLLVFSKSPGPLPPGPKGLPLIGSLDGLPTKDDKVWEFWTKHKDLYGPISSVKVLGTTIVVLNSPELAVELLDKRSLKYSSRPRFVFGELTGLGNVTPLVPYDNNLRVHRKLMHTMLGSSAAVKPYNKLQEVEVGRFLVRVLREPNLFADHLRTETAAFMLKMIYGYTVEPNEPDPLVELIEEAMTHFSKSVFPGSWLVDVIPALQYVPKWMPGTGWMKTSERWRKTIMDTTELPIRFARRRLARGILDKSFAEGFYNKKGDDATAEDHNTAKWVALSMFGGGSDTIVSLLSAFFLAMIKYPEVQRKAQEEIDQVIGTGRLPTFNDRRDLPYVEALVTEAWRWHTVVPIDTPHATSADDIVEGYFIPKGTLVIANIWWFLHDPAVYPNPSAFEPSRFLGANPAPDPTKHTFGYGRRICPGRLLARSSAWINIAQILAVFNISKGLDENGHEIDPAVAFTSSLISRPEKFKAMIKPRSSQHEALIRDIEMRHPWEESNSSELRL
ncbi:cytochrome protein [Xylaria nigripes]|nr:cytochrome protein [Xylaria nigripes]